MTLTCCLGYLQLVIECKCLINNADEVYERVSMFSVRFWFSSGCGNNKRIAGVLWMIPTCSRAYVSSVLIYR